MSLWCKNQNAPTCLIQEQETLGIVPVFWKNEQLADPIVLSIAQRS
jgi:hypothetical protein